MNRALLWIGGLLLVALSALFTVPRVVDWNSYRGVFEEEASRMLGRQVRVGGDVAVRLLPSPYVSFGQLRIADTTGTLGEPFFRADNVTMGLSIAPLLRGVVEATTVVVEKPVLTLALDAQGRGNWRDFRIAPGTLPFVPADVTFQSVSIADGTIGVRTADGSELARLDAITGEFSADSLDGPFKFRGLTSWDGKPRDVNFSTAKPDADGGIRFKALVRTGENGARYTLEATALELATRPRLSGELTAKLPFRTTAADAANPPRRAADAPGIDLKSKIYADTAGASLSELTLSFDQGDQPQFVVGEALASWLAGTRIKVKLSSLWLDLDRLARGARGEAVAAAAKAAAAKDAKDTPAAASAPPVAMAPARAVHALVPQLVAVLPRSASTEVEVAVEQVNLGGEVASNIGLSFVRGEGPMQLRALKASLPGGTQIDLSGMLTMADTGESFSGTVALNGTSVSRFLGWVLQRPAGIEQRSDGAFSLQGRIALDATSFDIRDATSELFGTPLAGALNYRWEGRRAAKLLLEGARIDVAALLPGVLDRLAIVDLLRPAPAAGEARPAATPKSEPEPAGDGAAAGWLADLGETDLWLRVRAGEVTDGRRVLRDVDADASLVAGKLTLAALALTTPEGLRVELEGELAGLDDAPHGMLRGVIGATSTTALGSLLDALGVRDDQRAARASAERGLAGLVPLRLAGSLKLGKRGDAAELTLDGAVRGGRTRASIQLDGGLDGWRAAPLDLSLRLDDAATGLALAELLIGRNQRLAAIDARALGKGEVVIRAKGIPNRSLLALASVRTPVLHLDYDGTARLPTTGETEIAGSARISAERAAPVLALIGLSAASGLAEAAIDGHLAFSAKGPALEIRPRALSIAGTPVDGVVQLAAGADGRQQIDARLAIETAHVTGLMSGILDTTGRAAPTPAAEIERARQIWPDRPFSLSAFDRLDGRLRLSMKSLTLADGLTLHDAALTAVLAPSRFAVEKLTGRAAGGTLTASLALDKATAGAAVKGRIAVDNGRLEELVGADAASGSASFDVAFSGRALSPRALVTVATGSGEARLVSATVKRLSPEAVDRTAEAVLAGEVQPTADALRETLLKLLPAQPLPLGSRRVQIEIVDGAARIGRIGFETEAARGSIETTLDLATLALDSDWRLGSKATIPATEDKPGKGPLPPISLVYVGPLGALRALEPRIGVEALEREMAVRKMERDVEELERLRRLDEEAAKAEADRQRLIEEAQRADAVRRAEEAAAAAARAAEPRALAPPVLTPPLPVPAVPAPGRQLAPLPQNASPDQRLPPQQLTTPGAGTSTSLVPAAGPADAPPQQPGVEAAADPAAGPRPPPRVTRKANPPAPSPFRPFDRNQLPQ